MLGLLIFLLLLGTGILAAQPQTFNHPELDWRTIETDHFYVHFHQGTERTARQTAAIAEAIWEPVTAFYDYVPDTKVHFIVRDYEDASNGAAFYYDNKIELWASAMDFPFRGTHPWLLNVVTHEFSHLISLGAARKLSRQIPAVYLQWMGYEKEKRPDVIHGYPNRLVSFPLAGTAVPPWFAEGMAQYSRAGVDFDTWDTHRDMVLRTAALEGWLLSLSEMSVFGKNSLGNERVYNQGYGLTLFIAHRFGDKAIRDLARAMANPLRMDFSSAVRKVLSMSEGDLYDLWADWLRSGYAGAVREIGPAARGKIIAGDGTGYFHPVFSPDGNQIAYLSNQGRDYVSQTSLWILDLSTGRRRKVKSAVTSSVSWSPDGTKLVYAKQTARTGQGSHFFDLYVFNLQTGKERRLTHTLRAREPDWSPDGSRFVFVAERDGTSNLYVSDTEGGAVRQVTNFQHGEQVFTPRWMGESGEIVFALSEKQTGREIAVVNASDSTIRYLVQSDADERDPFPVNGGKTILFSSDESGIFNLYSFDAATGETARLTNVTGGAFQPSGSPDRDVVYILFTADGFKLARLDGLRPVDEMGSYTSPYAPIQQAKQRESLVRPAEIIAIADTSESQPYKAVYSKLAFLPRLMVDFPGRLKAGSYFTGSDFLDQFSVLGGAALNSQFDVDLFGMFQYRQLYPTLFLEGYYQRRHTSRTEVDYAFDLIEVDLGADWQLGDHDALRSAYVYSRYAAKMGFETQGTEIKLPYTYHIGNVAQLRWTHRSVQSSLVSDIAPDRGRFVRLQAERAWQRFLDDFAVHSDYGTLVEVYRRYTYQQIQLDWREYMRIPLTGHSLALRVKAGFIDRPVEGFYNFFAGGLDGLKGYPFYSIEGRKLIHLGLAYRFPVFQQMNLKLWAFHFQKLYVSLYGQTGNAWDGGGIDPALWKSTVGMEARLKMVTFYTYPLCLFVDGAYGLDSFQREDIAYGGSWRTYFGILFDFPDGSSNH